jgi:hypothetical protein
VSGASRAHQLLSQKHDLWGNVFCECFVVRITTDFTDLSSPDITTDHAAATARESFAEEHGLLNFSDPAHSLNRLMVWFCNVATFREFLDDCLKVLALFFGWGTLYQELKMTCKSDSPLSRFVDTRFAFTYLAVWKLFKARSAMAEVLHKSRIVDFNKKRSSLDQSSFRSVVTIVDSDRFWLSAE